eukprot:gnl/Hemi2/18925_TR6267_c0_g17_i1.p2 gnl/Hemi2/18925_TR6267_c0_g17~~gnl/Hemi2/18925_TR6267_c0_g17_i1.p2  ORF type:complete len:286 (-),score=78.69 gnl/Hemi2/18925_TR6267_c0_g17_i1:202-1059(-)
MSRCQNLEVDDLQTLHTSESVLAGLEQHHRCDPEGAQIDVAWTDADEATNPHSGAFVSDSLKRVRRLQALAAEFFGSMLILTLACGIHARGASQLEGCLGVSGIMMGIIPACSYISGGHFNPAVTMCFSFLSRKIPIVLGLLYIVAQLLGATTGAFVSKLIMPNLSADEFADRTVSALKGISGVEGLFLEMFMTATLIFVVYSTAVSSRCQSNKLAPIPIAFVLLGLGLFGGSLTGASLNPARSVATAIVCGRYEDLWVYILGPSLGAICGWALYQLLHFKPKTD